MENQSKFSIKEYSKLCLHSLITGILVGVIVGLYQLGIQGVSSASKWMFSNDSWWIIMIAVVIAIAAAFLNELILKFVPSVDGSGIPAIELGIRGKKEIGWKKDIIAMSLNSFLSTFAGFPLGTSGPSVVIGGKISKMVHDVTKTGDEDNIAIACGTGFGCAFLSPIAGLCYIFEESLHKFNIRVVFEALITMVSAYLTTTLINHHHLLEIENAAVFQLNELYTLILLVIVNTAIGILFVKAIVFIKRLFTKLEKIKVIKYRGFILYGAVILLNVLCLGLMGSGTGLIGNIHEYTSLLVIGGILLFRFIMTVVTGSGKVTGGLVFPMMTLGAICGQFVASLCNTYFGLSVEINDMLILVSMCMIFGVITKTPITSIALVFSAIGASTGDYLHALINIPYVAIAIFLAVYISKWLKVDCLYEQFMEITLENEEKKLNDVK